METAKKLTREQIAEQFATLIRENGMSQVYGGDVSKQSRFYQVLFSRARTLDGSVDIYGERWVLVAYQTTYRDLPHNDRRVFSDWMQAFEFVRLAFVEHRFAAALDIPAKVW